MAGNTFGHIFTVTSFGESHGPAIGCVVVACLGATRSQEAPREAPEA